MGRPLFEGALTAGRVDFGYALHAKDDQRTLIGGHARPRLAVEHLVIVAGEAAPSGCNRDVLLAVRHIADDAAVVALAVVVLPQLGAGACVERVQPAARVGHAHEVAFRRQQAREGGLGVFALPLYRTCDRITRADVTACLAAVGRGFVDGEVGADIELSHGFEDGCRLEHLEVHAPLVADFVVQTGAWIVRPGVPAIAPGDVRAQRLVLAFRQVAPADQLAGLGVDALDEVDVLHALPDVLHLELRVVDQHEAALVRVHDVRLAVALEHHELANRAVEVPGVVRQFLMKRLELAGIGIERDDRGRVQVIARTGALGLPLRTAPVVQWRRIRGAPVHGVRLRLVAARHPASATTGLHGITAPRLPRGIALVVAADGEERPQQLAAGRVHTEDRPAIRPFAALRADDDLAVGEQRRPGETNRQLFRFDELRLPLELAR